MSEGSNCTDFRGRRPEKCLDNIRGPRALILKVERALLYSICSRLFSGWRMPGMQKARRRWCVDVGKSWLQWDDARAIVSSSVYRGCALAG